MKRHTAFSKWAKENLIGPDGQAHEAGKQLFFSIARMISPEKAAEELGVTPKTVRVWLRKGHLPGVRLWDKQWRIDPQDLDQFRLLTTTEAAAELGVTPKTMRKRLRDGQMVGAKRGKKWRINRDELLKGQWKKGTFQLLPGSKPKAVSGYKLWPPDGQMPLAEREWLSANPPDESVRDLSVFLITKQRILVQAKTPESIRVFASAGEFVAAYRGMEDTSIGRLPYHHPVFDIVNRMLRAGHKA